MTADLPGVAKHRPSDGLKTEAAFPISFTSRVAGKCDAPCQDQQDAAFSTLPSPLQAPRRAVPSRRSSSLGLIVSALAARNAVTQGRTSCAIVCGVRRGFLVLVQSSLASLVVVLGGNGSAPRPSLVCCAVPRLVERLSLRTTRSPSPAA
jgi:hypothetical protein